MDLDELQTVQSRERQTDSLQQLRDSFYSEASEYVQELRDARDRAAERADDPWNDPEVGRLSDEIETAEGTIEAIYDRRIGKIVKKASLAAANMPADEDGLTTEEQVMFEQLVENIEENREHVLDKIAGEVPADASPGAEQSDETPTSPDAASGRNAGSRSPSPADSTTDTDRTPAPVDTTEESTPGNSDETVSAADVMNDGGSAQATAPEPAQEQPSEPPDVPAEPDRPDGSTSEAVDRRTVRITEDIGEILGVDQREYDLSTDDVVTLPTDNAEPLLDRDAAQPLD
jgi:DNA replication factor GINS